MSWTPTRTAAVALAAHALACVALVAWSAPAAAAPEPVSVEGERWAGPDGATGRLTGSPDRPRLVVHYHRPDEDYSGWNLWTWGEGADGRRVDFEGRSAFGRFAVLPVEPGAERRGVIVRRGEWLAKDVDGDRWVDLDGDGFTEVWLVAGEPRVYTDPAEVDLSVGIAGAFLDDADSIFLTLTGSPGPGLIDGVRVLLDGSEEGYGVRRAGRADASGAARGLVYEIVLDRPVAFEHVSDLTLDIPGVGRATVYARDILTADRFTDLDARLGPEYSRSATTFRVWSPVSESVELLLFDEPAGDEPREALAMRHAGRGVWEVAVAGDLHGVFYQLAYHSYGERRVAPDIHCRAASYNSEYSMVVDLARAAPRGWGRTEPPTLDALTDEIIYEIHVRDFTIADPSLDAEPRLRGTYLGLLHEGSVDAPGGSVATGLAHLEELGVTAVHLLPIHDYPSTPGEYNWGYWTSLFNVPEANYATDLDDPLAPIRELKTAIDGLHRRDIRVILDVVYNHTSSSFEWSPFFQSVPYYWFRTTVDGRLRNDAGVGNSIADERPMVREYIADSLEFWLTEYRVDGFRFDLIGTHTPGSVAEWTDRLRRIRPDVTIYGEPWTGGGPLQFPKGAQRGVGLAVFNDHYRNAVRGDLDGTSTGFATGPGGDLAAIRNGVAGAIDDFADHPSETINYVSAHDNLTFWDKLLLANPAASEGEKRAMHKLAHGMVLTAQGIAFIHGGADFARTKGGNHNSYNAGDGVNKFDWRRKAEYADVFRYVRGLIGLRRAHPAFRLDERDEVRRVLRFAGREATGPGPVVAFELDGRAAGDAWSRIFVAYNGSPDDRTVELPAGRWTQVVDHERAGTEPITQRSGVVPLPPYSMAVLFR